MTTLLAQVQLRQVIEQLNQLAPTDLIGMYNEYASNNSYETIFDNDDDNINAFFDCPHEAVKSAFYGDYNPSHYYFVFNGYGNLASFSYTTDDNCPIDIEELAQWLISEDRLSEYDITVTTINDMLASIEDNITDASLLLYKLIDYLGNNIVKTSEYAINDAMSVISDYDYNQLNDIINHLGIDYE